MGTNFRKFRDTDPEADNAQFAPTFSEKARVFLRETPVTYFLILMFILGYLWMGIRHGSWWSYSFSLSAIEASPLDAGYLALDGQAWRLLSSMWMHLDPFMLLFGVVIMHKFRENEKIYGHLTYALMCIVCGLIANLGSALFLDILAPKGGSGGIGASVFGAHMAFIFFQRRHMPDDFWKPFWHSILLMLALIAVIIVASGKLDFGSDLCGVLSGFACAAVAQPDEFSENEQPWRYLPWPAARVALLGAVVMPIMFFTAQSWRGPEIATYKRADELIRTYDAQWQQLSENPVLKYSGEQPPAKDRPAVKQALTEFIGQMVQFDTAASALLTQRTLNPALVSILNKARDHAKKFRSLMERELNKIEPGEQDATATLGASPP